MRRNLIVAAAAGIAVIVLIGAGAYAYFFSGLRTSPGSLALSASPTATSSSPTAAPTGLAGQWKVTTGSLAGYRVQELFAGETSKHEAVARTTNVSGSLTVSGDATGYQISEITLAD